jgi:hypothetical protein
MAGMSSEHEQAAWAGGVQGGRLLRVREGTAHQPGRRGRRARGRKCCQDRIERRSRWTISMKMSAAVRVLLGCDSRRVGWDGLPRPDHGRQHPAIDAGMLYHGKDLLEKTGFSGPTTSEDLKDQIDVAPLPAGSARSFSGLGGFSGDYSTSSTCTFPTQTT